jgi:hypothetical protein
VSALVRHELYLSTFLFFAFFFIAFVLVLLRLL